MEINEEKRAKFMEAAGKRVNNVLHDMQILEPMARSKNYDFTRQDLDEMFSAMQATLDEVKEEFYKKFEAKEKATVKVFSFGQGVTKTEVEQPLEEISEEEDIAEDEKVEDSNNQDTTEV